MDKMEIKWSLNDIEVFQKNKFDNSVFSVLSVVRV